MTASPGLPGHSSEEDERLRFAIIRGDETCRIRMRASDGQINVEIDGAQALGQFIREALAGLEHGNSSAKSAEPLGQSGPLQQLAAAVRKHLQDIGLGVHEIPEGDMQIQMEMNTYTGQVLGASNALHPFTSPSPELARRIHESIQDAFHRDRRELTAKLQAFTAAGQHEQAAQAVVDAKASLALNAGVDTALFTALVAIEIDKLSGDARRRVLEVRAAVGAELERSLDIESDVNLLLKELDAEDERWASLRNVLGIIAVKKGQTETALSIWRGLLKQPERLHAGERGWLWRNVSMSLRDSDPESARAARLSADAFLEEGDKVQAARSLRRVSQLLEHSSTSQALEQLDAIQELAGQHRLQDKQLLAALHHAKGNRLRELRNHGQALHCALEAVTLLRGVLGLEEQLLSSLHLAQIEAQESSDAALAEKLNQEAKELESRSGSKYFALARRIPILYESYSAEAAAQLLAEARDLQRFELVAAVRTISAIAHPDLDASARLQELEAVLSELPAGSAGDSASEPVLLAISQVLTAEGEHERAVIWLRELLTRNPLQLNARDKLLNLLWVQEAWGDAATFLAEQLKRDGERPGLLCAYGKSLLNAGDATGAVVALQKCLNHAEVTADMRTAAMEFRERALNLGGQPASAASPLMPEGPVLREEVTSALRDFAKFISADKRMRFWVPPDKDRDYTWVERPEQRAQDLLHTFLKARFQHRVSVFEEVGAGAGRLDILLRVEGGMSIIIELKMCGFGYPSTYAASGEDQIRHYMENRSVHLGYLVVMDARLSDERPPLLQPNSDPVNTVTEVLVDMCPRVSRKKKTGR